LRSCGVVDDRDGGGTPIFLMVLRGNVLGGRNASVNIGVVDNAGSTVSRAYVSTLEHDKNLVVEKGSASHEEDRLQHDDVVAIVVIAPGFGAPPCAPEQRCLDSGVNLQLDSNDPSNSQIAARVINAVTQLTRCRSGSFPSTTSPTRCTRSRGAARLGGGLFRPRRLEVPLGVALRSRRWRGTTRCRGPVRVYW